MCWNIECNNIWIDDGWRVGIEDMSLLDRGDEVPVRVSRLSEIQAHVKEMNDKNVQSYFNALGNISKFTEEMMSKLLVDVEKHDIEEFPILQKITKMAKQDEFNLDEIERKLG